MLLLLRLLLILLEYQLPILHPIPLPLQHPRLLMRTQQLRMLIIPKFRQSLRFSQKVHNRSFSQSYLFLTEGFQKHVIFYFSLFG
jgi:hypothetical protein